MKAHVNNPMKRTATLCIWCCPKIHDGSHRFKRTKSRRVPRIERHTTINLQPTNKAQTATAPETNLVSTQRDATYFEAPQRERETVTCCTEPTTTTQTECFLPKVPSATARTAGIRNGSQCNKPRAQTQSPQDKNLESLRRNRNCRSHVQPNSTKQRRYWLQSPCETCATETPQDQVACGDFVCNT